MARPRTASEMKAAFGEDDLLHWHAALARQIPDAPTMRECLLAPEAPTFVCKGRRLGVTLRFELHDGQTVTLNLNPLVAKSLIETIAKTGQGCGWMNLQGHITFPEA